MTVLSLCWRGSPAASPSNPSERTRISSRRRKHGTTGRLALPHQNRRYGEIVETVRSAPGRDPRMAGFIRILSALARKSRGRQLREFVGPLDTSGESGVFRPELAARSTRRDRRSVDSCSKILNINRKFPLSRVPGRSGRQVSRGIDDGSIHFSRAGLPGGRHGEGVGGDLSGRPCGIR